MFTVLWFHTIVSFMLRVRLWQDLITTSTPSLLLEYEKDEVIP